MTALSAPAAVHDQVCALWPKDGQFYAAKVTAEREEESEREVKVHFDGWNARYDRWCTHDELRAPTAAADAATTKNRKKYGSVVGLVADGKKKAVYQLDRIVGKKVIGGRVFYTIRWTGFGEADDTDERAKDVNDEDIKEFERTMRLATASARGAERVANIPRRSVCKAAFEAERPGIRKQRVADAHFTLRLVGKDSAPMLKRAKRPAACVRLNQRIPMRRAEFAATHAAALEAQKALGITNEEAVTPLVPIKGGAQPEDGFSINEVDIFETFLEPATGGEPRISGVCRYVAANKCAGLMPPYEFTWRRDELVVTGHVVTLVRGSGAQAGYRLATHWQAFTYPATDEHAYKLAFKARRWSASRSQRTSRRRTCRRRCSIGSAPYELWDGVWKV